MSFFDEVNEDAVFSGEGYAGPRVGFLDAFETSYNSQVRASAMFGIEKAFYDMEYEQVSKLRKAGVEDIPHVSDDAFGFFGKGAASGEYLDAAKFYEDGGEPELASRLKAYDSKIAEYRKKYPDLDLRTSDEMWNEIRETARKYEARSADEKRSWGGTAGMLTGGMAGAFNLESDPFNFATIPLGSFGKTIAARIGAQAGVQGITETINQITGVQEQRRLLGLDHGFADGLTRVGGAVIGGAAFQGLGEAVGVGARRFFRSAPNDPAPAYEPAPIRQTIDTRDVPDGVIPAEPERAAAKLEQRPQTYMEYLQEVSPWSVSRAGKARTVLDIDNVKTQLDDWATDPAFMLPKTDTMITPPRGDFTAQPNIFERVADKSNIDSLARQIDPDTFRVFDKLADENATFRRWLAELGGEAKDKRIADELLELNNQIDELKEKTARSGKMKGKKYAAQIAELTKQRDEAKAKATVADTPDMAKVRAKLTSNDEKMRDMSPVVSRAYARAQNKWDNTAQDRAAITAMIRDGRKSVGDIEERNPLESLPKSLYDKAPILRGESRVKGKIAQDADAADVAREVLAQRAKEADEVIETYRTSVQSIIKKADEIAESGVKPKQEPGELAPDEILVPGFKEPLNMRDKITVPNEDGAGTREITIRQLLEEQRDGEEDLKAISSCSIV